MNIPEPDLPSFLEANPISRRALVSLMTAYKQLVKDKLSKEDAALTAVITAYTAGWKHALQERHCLDSEHDLVKLRKDMHSFLLQFDQWAKQENKHGKM